jgi:hypothetical protein
MSYEHEISSCETRPIFQIIHIARQDISVIRNFFIKVTIFKEM